MLIAFSLLTALPWALAAPGTTSTSPATSTARPLALQSSFLYDLDQITIGVPSIKSDNGVNISAGIYIVDMENHSRADIKRYKGKTSRQCWS